MKEIKSLVAITIFLFVVIRPFFVFADDLIFPEKSLLKFTGIWTEFNFEAQSIKSQHVENIILRPYYVCEKKNDKGAFWIPGYQFVNIRNSETKMKIHRIILFGAETSSEENALGLSGGILEPTELEYKDKKNEWQRQYMMGITWVEISFRYLPLSFLLLQVEPFSIGQFFKEDGSAFRWYFLPRLGLKLGNLNKPGIFIALGPELLFQGENGKYYDFVTINLGGFLKIWIKTDILNLRILAHGGWNTETENKKVEYNKTEKQTYKGFYGGSSLMVVF